MNLFFILYFVVAVIGYALLLTVVERISTRFCFMPSTEALILSIVYFIIAFNLAFIVFGSFISDIGIYIGIAGLIKLVQFIKLSRLEATIFDSSSISKIIELQSNGIHGAYDIVKVLKLKYRDDYNSLIPKIIDNLKYRNKLPTEITIEPGSTLNFHGVKMRNL